ncbi:MAG: enolase C-terminal domain-like protein, partial [Terriglobia bacterium]
IRAGPDGPAGGQKRIQIARRWLGAGGRFCGTLRTFVQIQPMMIEQPLAKEDLEGAAMLQRRLHTPVCLDEGIETAEDARRAIDLGACRIVNIKLQRVGGFLEALRIMKICREGGIPLWLGTMPELGIGTAQLLALAGHPGIHYPTDAHPSRRWFVDDVVKPEIKLHRGGLLIPAGPGLGYEIDESKVSRYCASAWHFGSGKAEF